MMKNGMFTSYIAYGVGIVSLIGGIVLANGGKHDDFSLITLLIVWIAGLISFTLLMALSALQDNQDTLIQLNRQLIEKAEALKVEPPKTEPVKVSEPVENAPTEEKSEGSYKGIYY